MLVIADTVAPSSEAVPVLLGVLRPALKTYTFGASIRRKEQDRTASQGPSQSESRKALIYGSIVVPSVGGHSPPQGAFGIFRSL